MRVSINCGLPLAGFIFCVVLAPGSAQAVTGPLTKNCPAEPTQHVPISSGLTYSGPNCVISTTGDADGFQFTAAAGDIWMVVVALGPSASTNVCLFPTSGRNPDVVYTFRPRCPTESKCNSTDQSRPRRRHSGGLRGLWRGIQAGYIRPADGAVHLHGRGRWGPTLWCGPGPGRQPLRDYLQGRHSGLWRGVQAECSRPGDSAVHKRYRHFDAAARRPASSLRVARIGLKALRADEFARGAAVVAIPTTATEPQVLPKAGPASAETNICQTIPNNSPESLLTFSSWLLRNHFLFRRHFAQRT
jgi:hypothetical protein